MAARRRWLLLAALAGLGACGGSGGATPDGGVASAPDGGVESAPDGAGANDDPDPTFTPAQRAALQTLRYDDGAPPADPSNRVADDPAAAEFGRRLFFAPAFSGPLLEGDNDGTSATLGMKGEAGRVSCAGCHLPASGFVDTRSPHEQVSLGAQWTMRRTPTLLEVAFAPLFNWDGRRDAIWNQALGVMESNREFNSSRLFVAEQLFRLHRAEYEALFGAMPPLDDGARFPALTPETTGCVEVSTMMGSTFKCRGVPGDGADFDGMQPADQAAVSAVAANATKAIAAYVRQLRCGAGRFDQWLDGDETALTRAEQRGAALFVGTSVGTSAGTSAGSSASDLAGSASCASCHAGPRLTDGAFHNVGVSPAIVAVAIQDLDDRGAATGIAAALTDPTSTAGALSDGDRHALPAAVTPKLEGAFRTPTLRCVASHPSFMHTGQLGALDQVVAFFDRGGDRAGGYPGANELAPLGLSDRDRADLVAFLGALSGPGPAAALLGPPSP
jgi:cytochrome c peroxidase